MLRRVVNFSYPRHVESPYLYYEKFSARGLNEVFITHSINKYIQSTEYLQVRFLRKKYRNLKRLVKILGTP